MDQRHPRPERCQGTTGDPQGILISVEANQSAGRSCVFEDRPGVSPEPDRRVAKYPTLTYSTRMEERQHFLQKDRLMAGRTFDGGGRHWGAGSRPDDSFPAMAQVKFFLNDCMIL
jgi:hypothetical protein